jgi:hypothetical protein
MAPKMTRAGGPSSQDDHAYEALIGNNFEPKVAAALEGKGAVHNGG